MSRIASSLPLSPAVTLDQTSAEPLYRQLYRRLRDAILEGKLSQGAQIPSSRELARELGVGRNTVLSAIEQLIAEGYLQGARGSGTYVHRTLPDDIVRVQEPRRPQKSTSEKSYQLSAYGDALATARLLRLSVGPPKPFQPAVPALDAFPFKLWLSLLQKYWKRGPSALLGFGDPAGYLPLRQAIAAHLAVARAVRCEAEQVLVVSGAQQALDLTARLLLNPGDRVWIEEPGYVGATDALQAVGACLVPVPVDEQGMNIQAGITRGAGVRLAYVTPSHQFPLGMTMTLARRLELLTWSHRTRAWIIEDDYDSEYRYSSRPIAALQGLDPHGRVIYVGTFSKVLFPSLRLGYLVAPAELVNVFTAARITAAGQPPLIEQAVLAEFMADGHFSRHIRRMRTLYDERRNILLEEARRELAEVLDIQSPEAGMHTIGWLVQGVDDRKAAARVSAEGVDTVPLSPFYRARGQQSGLLLGFAAFSPSDIRTGVRQLARALRRLK